MFNAQFEIGDEVFTFVSPERTLMSELKMRFLPPDLPVTLIEYDFVSLFMENTLSLRNSLAIFEDVATPKELVVYYLRNEIIHPNVILCQRGNECSGMLPQAYLKRFLLVNIVQDFYSFGCKSTDVVPLIRTNTGSDFYLRDHFSHFAALEKGVSVKDECDHVKVFKGDFCAEICPRSESSHFSVSGSERCDPDMNYQSYDLYGGKHLISDLKVVAHEVSVLDRVHSVEVLPAPEAVTNSDLVERSDDDVILVCPYYSVVMYKNVGSITQILEFMNSVDGLYCGRTKHNQFVVVPSMEYCDDGRFGWVDHCNLDFDIGSYSSFPPDLPSTALVFLSYINNSLRVGHKRGAIDFVPSIDDYGIKDHLGRWYKSGSQPYTIVTFVWNHVPMRMALFFGRYNSLSYCNVYQCYSDIRVLLIHVLCALNKLYGVDTEFLSDLFSPYIALSPVLDRRRVVFDTAHFLWNEQFTWRRNKLSLTKYHCQGVSVYLGLLELVFMKENLVQPQLYVLPFSPTMRRVSVRDGAFSASQVGEATEELIYELWLLTQVGFLRHIPGFPVRYMRVIDPGSLFSYGVDRLDVTREFMYGTHESAYSFYLGYVKSGQILEDKGEYRHKIPYENKGSDTIMSSHSSSNNDMTYYEVHIYTALREMPMTVYFLKKYLKTRIKGDGFNLIYKLEELWGRGILAYTYDGQDRVWSVVQKQNELIDVKDII